MSEKKKKNRRKSLVIVSIQRIGVTNTYFRLTDEKIFKIRYIIKYTNEIDSFGQSYEFSNLQYIYE